MPSSVDISRKEGGSKPEKNGLTLFDTLVFWIIVLVVWNIVLTVAMALMAWKLSSLKGSNETHALLALRQATATQAKEVLH